MKFTSSKRLYIFDPAAAPKELRGLIGGKIREGPIIQNWRDILRAIATMAADIIPPSSCSKNSQPIHAVNGWKPKSLRHNLAARGPGCSDERRFPA